MILDSENEEEAPTETEIAVEAYFDTSPRPLRFDNISSSQVTDLTTNDESGTNSATNGASPYSINSNMTKLPRNLIPLDKVNGLEVHQLIQS